jgi:hypothetical protein
MPFFNGAEMHYQDTIPSNDEIGTEKHFYLNNKTT